MLFLLEDVSSAALLSPLHVTPARSNVRACCLLLPRLGLLWVESMEPQPQVSKGLSRAPWVVASNRAQAVLRLPFSRSQKLYPNPCLL